MAYLARTNLLYFESSILSKKNIRDFANCVSAFEGYLRGSSLIRRGGRKRGDQDGRADQRGQDSLIRELVPAKLSGCHDHTEPTKQAGCTMP